MNNRVTAFRQLHAKPEPLRLPNAWDAGSARLFESLGAPAIATTSAGQAWALGYPDGYKLPTGVVLGLAANMRRVVKVPLSVDIENGYSVQPEEVADFVLRLADAGVDGINIEDGRDAPANLAGKIDAIKSALASRNMDLFVNARTDVFLASLVEPAKMVAEVLARGAVYASAGADGLFVPGLAKADQITTIVAGVKLPLNVMAWSGLASAAELGKLGVHRLSAGSAIAQILWAQAETLGKEFLATGRSDAFDESPKPYPQIQALFT